MDKCKFYFVGVVACALPYVLVCSLTCVYLNHSSCQYRQYQFYLKV